MTAIIIDDEPLARKIIIEFLKDKENISVVAECSNGYEGLKQIQELQPDFIFLDIQMPKINGFEMLELIPDPPKVIFTTAHDEFAIKAFDANAIDYLLKPFSKKRFDESLSKLNGAANNQASLNELLTSPARSNYENNRVVIKDGAEIFILPVTEISHIEAYDDYVKIHHIKKVYLKKQTMNYYVNSLNNEHFVRIHRSYILNINYLSRIESFEKNSYVAILKDNVRLPISRNNYARLKELLDV